jgi:hypothetical protein
MNIYYRFYYDDFFSELKNRLDENETKNRVERFIIILIKSNPFEFYQIIKGEIPKWFQFQFLNVLFDKDLLPNDNEEALDGLTIKDYDLNDFMHYLIILNIDYVDFMNFFSLYENNKIVYTVLEMYLVKCVIGQFKKFKATKINKNKLEELLMTIFDDLSKFKNSNFIINSLAKVINQL